MRLRRQLILVSLLTLSLPWAGCQYIEEMEGALRQGQVIALSASAQAVADRLGSDKQLMDVITQSAFNADSEPQIYAHPLKAPVILDGYDDDWRYLKLTPQTLTSDQGSQDKLAVSFIAGTRDNKLYVFAQVDDRDIHYHNPAKSQLASGDHVVLRSQVKRRGKLENRDFIIRSGAPGNITAVYQAVQGKRKRVITEQRIRGYWQERQGGYQLELEVPLDLLQGQLALAVRDVGRSTGKASETWLGTVSERSPAPPLVLSPQSLSDAIGVFAHDDLRLRLVSQNQWLIAQGGDLNAKPQYRETESTQHGLLPWLYRMALGNVVLPDLDNPKSSGRFNNREVDLALTGTDASQWYQWGVKRVGRAVVPVFDDQQQAVAAVVAEQSSDSLLALTNSAFNRLFFYSLLATLFAGVGLLAYASWLSFRIRKLNRAADSAIAENGQIVGDFPQSRAADEVGDLTRSYGQLLGRLREYTEYLRTLSSKLSHELRTPLAVVRTSIDNLEHEELTDSARTYAQRAHEGTTRLSNILNAMSSASRVEESIQHAEWESVRIDQMIRELSQAYQDIYTHARFDVTVDKTVTQREISAAAELLVQMLDKLVDNAADFCPEDGRIILGLYQTPKQLILSVINDGPLLPEKMHTQLFDSLVSIRPEGQGAKVSDSGRVTSHLGLGLHIVRLIADFHRASVSARNRNDGSGVVFEVRFPLG
ncbi:proteobacterial dedicated sortase system histidine kinase [Maricurvus nonylphenolicus]|uniref:proteobacterial dedicated sortase system histidine kinase n=1 Tax=Maricurvus nonylphenolicus TaxID=1008307 RepID=UPI0036F3B1A8